MSLQTTNISTSLVAGALGLASRNVGVLCSKALSGGIATTSGFNSAFYIKENGSTETNGNLIAGALPLYNIYSSAAPGIWTKTGNAADYVYYRLKRDATNSKYCFKLGSFGGYDATAIAPSLGGFSIEAISNSNTAETLEARIIANLGSYDWINLLGAANFKILVFNGGSKICQSEILPIELNTDIEFTSISFVHNVTFEQHLQYTVYISLLNDANGELGRLPLTNILYVDILSAITQHPNIFNVTVIDNFTGTFTEFKRDSNTLYKTYSQPFETYLDNPMNLQSINYTLYNSSNEIINSQIVTTFGQYDAPLSITRIRENVNILFKAQYNEERLYPNLPLGEYLMIDMNYDY